MRISVLVTLLNLLGLILLIATWSPLVYTIFVGIEIVLLGCLLILMQIPKFTIVRKWYWKLFLKPALIRDSRKQPLQLETSIQYFIQTEGEEQYTKGIKVYDASYKAFIESELKTYCK